MKKIVLVISAAICLIANDLNINTALKIKKVKQQQEEAILNLAIEHEELYNQNLKMAQRLNDLENAMNQCCGNKYFVHSFNSDKDIKTEKNIKRSYILEEKDIYIDNSDMCNNTKELLKNTKTNPTNSAFAKTKQSNNLKDKYKQDLLLNELFLYLNKQNIEETVSITSKILNIRELPTMSSKIISQLKFGEQVKYLGVVKNNISNSLWLQLEEGYIYADYTTFKKVVEATKRDLKKDKK